MFCVCVCAFIHVYTYIHMYLYTCTRVYWCVICMIKITTDTRVHACLCAINLLCVHPEGDIPIARMYCSKS